MKSDSLLDLEADLEALHGCMGRGELEVLERLVECHGALDEALQREVSTTISLAVTTLRPLVHSIEASPINQSMQYLNGRERTAESLIETLCYDNWLPVEMSMPTGAVVGRTLIQAKINFFKALVYSLERSDDGNILSVRTTIGDLIDEGVFSKLADELLTAAVSNPKNGYETRSAAARKLLKLWTNCVAQPVMEFPSVLLSAWRARRKVQAIYGTLGGTNEMVLLEMEALEKDFVTFFTRDQVTTDQTEAFREFLFALPYEELQQLQEHMKETGIPVLSTEQVYSIVKKTLPRPQHGVPSAEEVFASYRRRRIRAEYRSLSSSPGPHKTAEGYIMEFLLTESNTKGA